MLTKDLTDLSAADLIIQQHIFIKALLKILIFLNGIKKVIHQLLKDFTGIRVFRRKLQFAAVDPVLRYEISQIFIETNAFFRGPGILYLIIFRDLIRQDDPVTHKKIHDIALINLVFLGKLVVDGLFLKQFLP